MCHTLYSLAICFAPSLADSIIFLTLTRLVVVIKFVNFRFSLFTPSLGDFQFVYRGLVLANLLPVEVVTKTGSLSTLSLSQTVT